jgi:hypothetical protein
MGGFEWIEASEDNARLSRHTVKIKHHTKAALHKLKSALGFRLGMALNVWDGRRDSERLQFCESANCVRDTYHFIRHVLSSPTLAAGKCAHVVLLD